MFTPAMHSPLCVQSTHFRTMAARSDAPDAASNLLIASLSKPPYPRMISIRDGAIRPTILVRTLTSSLGLLDALPIELLHIILNLSNFQTLLRFARVCHQAKAMVDSLLSYQAMMKHASTTLVALSRSKLITVHTAGTLHAALLSDKCVLCQKFGAYLFLPTCERCCFWCLQTDRSLQVITARTAGVCFGVSAEDLCQIPMMLGILRDDARGRKNTSLINGLYSLKQAEKLGISVHESRDAMKSVCVVKPKGPIRERILGRWLSSVKSGSYSPRENHSGITSINFPSLRPNGEIENGLCCRGCMEFFDDQYYSTSSRDPERTRILSRRGQARSRSEFLEHIKDCKGARDLIPKVMQGTF